MSTTKTKILRDATGVSELNLPKWDRQGNDVKAPVTVRADSPVVQTVTPDIEEESIQAPTVKELEQIREDAYNEGFEQGYEQGLKQGAAEGKTQGITEGTEQGYQDGMAQGIEVGQAQALEEGTKATEQSLAVFQSMSDALAEYRHEDEQELEKALGALAVRIARQVVQDELRTKPSHINSLVHAAVQALPNPDEKLTIRLNPIDYEFVAASSETNWELVSDDDIRAGGCTVKSGYSYIDYTLEHRFETAVKQLISHFETDVADATLQAPISDDYLLDNNLSEHKKELKDDDESETNSKSDEHVVPTDDEVHESADQADKNLESQDDVSLDDEQTTQLDVNGDDLPKVDLDKPIEPEPTIEPDVESKLTQSSISPEQNEPRDPE